MEKPTRGDALLATAATGAKAQTTLALENTPMSDVIQALECGRVTATALTKGYLARIEAYDRDGPKLNSVRELDADVRLTCAPSGLVWEITAQAQRVIEQDTPLQRE